MSRLSDIESAIITQLKAATISGNPAFATVDGVSGGNRPSLRAAMRRERMPVAYVAFIEENVSPDTRPTSLGAKFSVLVADDALRQAKTPHIGDVGTVGAFALIDIVRSALSGYAAGVGIRLVETSEKFVDADERVAIYELSFRAWPIDEPAPEILRYDGEAIGGLSSLLSMEVGSFDVVFIETNGEDGGNREAFEISPRPIRWVGDLIAFSHSALTNIEDGIELLIADQSVAGITDGNGRTFSECAIDRFERKGPRRVVRNYFAQTAVIHFSQLEPIS